MSDIAKTALREATFKPFWLDRADAPDALPRLAKNLTADLLVVGGGFTGLWGAIQARQTQPDWDVVLIERDVIASGASGRPGGVVSTSVMHGLSNAVRIFPKDIGELERLGKENLLGMMETIERFGIDCHAEWGGELTIAVDPAHIEDLHREHELHLRYGHNAVFLDETAIQAEIKSPRYKAAVWSKDVSGTVHPALLAWGLKRVALELGVRIFEHTELAGLVDLDGRIEAETPRGRITAPRVLLATNAFAAGHRHIKRRVVPLRDRVLATEPLSPSQMESVGWKHRQGAYDTRTQLNYTRLTKDNRVIFGGRLAYGFGGASFSEVDVHAEAYEPLARVFFETFPQLEGVRFANAWSGPIDLTTRMAVHFQRYYDGKVVYAGGYSGFGISASRFGARIALDILEGSKSPESRLEFATSLPATVPPEPFRWLGAQITMYAVDTADKKGGWRRPWLKFISAMGFPLN